MPKEPNGKKKKFNYKRLIANRILLTGLLLAVQVVWFVVFLWKLVNYSVYISLFFFVLSLLIVLYVVGKDDNPAYKIGWLVLIMALPLAGGLFYLCFGNKKPAKKLGHRLNLAKEQFRGLLSGQEEAEAGGAEGLLRAEDERAAGTCSYLYRTNGYPVCRNTDVTYYPLGEDMFRDMLSELRRAEHFIFLEYFIIEPGVMWDQILEILTEKAEEGLDVRLIYDDMGCVALLPGRYHLEMEKRGIKCIAFNPFVPFLSLAMNNRDHRKILVIDGHTAFSGGINLADEYINAVEKHGHWKDTGIRLIGEAVWNFTEMFLEMWNAFRKTDSAPDRFRPHVWHPQKFCGSGYVQPYGDTPLDQETTGENVYLEILNQAKHYVYIFTPYLIVDNEMKSALCLAVKRGVDVRIVTPGIPDKKIVYRLTRSNYTPLLESGVRIYEYTPGFLHAKCFVCDDRFAVVGTINMDYRSLYLHFECGTFLYGTDMTADLKQDALATIAKSREVRPADQKTGFFGRLFDAVLRLAAPLF